MEPHLQPAGAERPVAGALLVLLACHVAPRLPEEPLQEVLHGAERAGGVTAPTFLQNCVFIFLP